MKRLLNALNAVKRWTNDAILDRPARTVALADIHHIGGRADMVRGASVSEAEGETMIGAAILIVGSMAVYAFAPNQNDWLLALAISCQALAWSLVILGYVATVIGNKAVRLADKVVGGKE